MKKPRLKLGVAIAERLFAQRCLHPAGKRVADPDDCAEKDAEDKLQCDDHDSLRDFLYQQRIKREIKASADSSVIVPRA